MSDSADEMQEDQSVHDVTAGMLGVSIHQPTGTGLADDIQLTPARRPLDAVNDAGPAAPPIRFPPPEYLNGSRADEVLVYNEDSGEHFVARDVLFRSHEADEEEEGGLQSVSRAYWKIPDKEPITTRMGHLEICVVLARCPRSADSDTEEEDSRTSSGNEDDIVFLLTNRLVAVKVNYCERMERSLHITAENPLNEIAALQIVGTNHPNVLGCEEVLFDTEYLSVVMPYCGGGDLFQVVDDYLRENPTSHGLPEPQVRYWFRQMLEGMKYLQSCGICHRDLSPENVIINEDKCLIIDLGMSLRVPYSSTEPDNTSVTDVTQGTQRRLIIPQGQCGKRRYMSPEIWRNRENFDGFAVDIWTAGTILFFMLTGQTYLEPYDAIFNAMVIDLSGLLRHWNMNVSDDAIDLLQRILVEDPRERLTLEEIATHAW
eukprot:CAMPEP_0183327576 /NCGR_PEP_ID=MMETSP0160_2-20130417/83837_1 /TAXON_ID=2839 ORGANISM="Odontella Sinensis, Strain Grunow 1884" /NCGR_SAMPLE_ID=MMETSP0160_2 /ASSEMBLY_ACC=CAM_ASM_000250 /LENGTH=429 /DNA_ID=CAMNT_0025495711 /DNA_START=1284 /DNA_END=2570 /DNA_ORIENTATION=-